MVSNEDKTQTRVNEVFSRIQLAHRSEFIAQYRFAMEALDTLTVLIGNDTLLPFARSSL